MQDIRVLQYHLIWTMQGTFAETGNPEEKPLLNDSKTPANKINAAAYVLTNKLCVKARNAHHIHTLHIR